MINKIFFHSNREYSLYSKEDHPEPSSKFIPKWYSDADKYVKDPNTGEHVTNYDGGKMPSFKACPAMLDIYTTGYMLKTPCDLFFYEKNGIVEVKTPNGYEDFCASRPPMPDFISPEGYHLKHFHWYAQWAPELPEGYSAIYLNPINRFDIPFITVAGIIDNDKVTTPGLIPFFLRKGFTGVVPKGTPYIQIIPFKREDWESEIKLHNQEEIIQRYKDSADMFRKPGGDVYKKNIWSRRKYK
jgi:hypothetical protein